MAQTIELTDNALTVLDHRYLLKNARGDVVETPEEMFRRVARAVASGEARFGGQDAVRQFEEQFYRLMTALEFLPNSPTLMNAGTSLGQLAACFVLPVGDSIAEIFGAVRDMALIHQSGGGTGFSFSRLRPRGDVVHETAGVASGPVSFMQVFDLGTEVVKQGGRRRGANMGILRVDHPDILEFIAAKQQPGRLSNFNLSVGVTDDFMRRLQNDDDFALINPRTGRETDRLSARKVWQTICEAAWHTGDPGVVFLDEINRHNPTPSLGDIEATNPCGEQPLLPYEACNLGSINLSRLVAEGDVDWPTLRDRVTLAVRFLDDVIEVCHYPLPEIDRITRGNRKIGLGVMGFAELLIQLGVPYASEGAEKLALELSKTITETARAASRQLADERGSFANFRASVWPARGFDRLRNASLTTIAPTGTISLVAGTSSGIEPLFALSYERSLLDGQRLQETNRFFRQRMERDGCWDEQIAAAVLSTGTLAGVDGVPDETRRLLQTALEVAPEWHVRIQAAFQRHTDNAVSKTCNLPESATVQDVQDIYELAYRKGCKGVTVFRNGCRDQQVLYAGKMPSIVRTDGRLTADPEYAGECRICSV